MATSQDTQESLLQAAYRLAGVNAADIDYVELHGTGFLKGDAVEARALGEVVGNQTERQHSCRIGSVKTNIGHTGAAAGIAGVIKMALAFYHQELPPTLHLQEINPDIPLAQLQLTPQKELTRWPAKKEGRPLACVTALALSGTNAHAVLEGYHVATPARGEQPQLRLLPLSAASNAALLAQAMAFRQILATTEASWRNICYTAAIRRNHYQYRLVLAASTAHEAAMILDEAFTAQSPVLTQELPDKLMLQGTTPNLSDITIRHLLGDKYDLLIAAQPQPPLPQEQPLSSNEPEPALSLLPGRLYTQGYTLHWSALFAAEEDQDARCVSLPTYPWQRERLWPDWLDSEEISTPPEKRHPEKQDQSSVQPAPDQRLWHVLHTTSTDQWSTLLLEYLQKEVSSVLEIDPLLVQEVQYFFALGMNSLTATQFTNRIQRSLGCSLASTVIFSHPTVKLLADYLTYEVLSQKNQQQRAISQLVPHPSFALEQLSDLETETLLTSKLTMIEEILREQPR